MIFSFYTSFLLKLPLYISKRYLFAPKSNNAINIITGVSIVGIAVGTAAMILVLSIFNGLTGFIESLFDAIDSDLRIEAALGKTIPDSDSVFQLLQKYPKIAVVSKTIELKVGLEYYDRQAQAVIKGVDAQFTRTNPIDSVAYLYEGSYDLRPINGVYRAVLGSQVAETLNASTADESFPIKVFVPTDGPIKLGNPMPSFKTDVILPVGYFSIQKEYDEQYVLTDLTFARGLMGSADKLTAYEIGLKNKGDAERVKEDLKQLLGEKYKILTIKDKHETLYKVMRNEKRVSALILVLLVILVTVNIVGSLSMIVLEKTRDIAVLKSYGATAQTIRSIFLSEGLWVGGIGVFAGMIFGLGIAYLQVHWGFIKLGGGDSFRITAYPIEVHFWDCTFVGITVLGLSMLASLYPSFKAANITIVEGLRQ